MSYSTVHMAYQRTFLRCGGPVPARIGQDTSLARQFNQISLNQSLVNCECSVSAAGRCHNGHLKTSRRIPGYVHARNRGTHTLLGLDASVFANIAAKILGKVRALMLIRWEEQRVACVRQAVLEPDSTENSVFAFQSLDTFAHYRNTIQCQASNEVVSKPRRPIRA